MDDVVIDTNVLVHATNPNEDRFDDALTLLGRISETEIKLCIDDGYNMDPARNGSHILAEYLEHIGLGSVPYVVLEQLALAGRIQEYNRRSDQATARKVNQLIRNKRDRTFINVAHQSVEKVLVSHDYIDYQVGKRDTIRRELGVDVIEALDCHDRI